jgi:hypothetical protein
VLVASYCFWLFVCLFFICLFLFVSFGCFWGLGGRVGKGDARACVGLFQCRCSARAWLEASASGLASGSRASETFKDSAAKSQPCLTAPHRAPPRPTQPDPNLPRPTPPERTPPHPTWTGVSVPDWLPPTGPVGESSRAGWTSQGAARSVDQSSWTGVPAPD